MTASYSASPLFPRGKTWYNGQTIDTADYGNSVAVEGQVAVFPNYNTGSNRAVNRDATRVVCLAVRNGSGITLEPTRLVVWADGYRGRRVGGYSCFTAVEVAGIVDEHLPSTGVVNGDIFWIVVEGQTLALTSLTSATNAANLFTAGTAAGNGASRLVAITGATTGATTSGRLSLEDGTALTSLGFDQIRNTVGRAMSANTSSGTNRQLLVDVKLV